jgi:hypothetical protein
MVIVLEDVDAPLRARETFCWRRQGRTWGRGRLEELEMLSEEHWEVVVEVRAEVEGLDDDDVTEADVDVEPELVDVDDVAEVDRVLKVVKYGDVNIGEDEVVELDELSPEGIEEVSW